MKTRKEVSTISYCSQEFLVIKLNQLLDAHSISDWMFINHFAESDETKNHIHLWIKPNGQIDTMDLQDFLTEYNPDNPKKPFRCIDFRSSKTDDWILYEMHHTAYLASKGESREFHYTKDDFLYADEDSFLDYYNHALKGSDWAKRNQILCQLAENRVNPTHLILNGTVPLTLASQLNAFKFLESHYGKCERGTHSGHEEKEILENVETN